MTDLLPGSLSEPTVHHTSHQHLLHRGARPSGTATVDAVIVPSARPATELRPAVALAAALRAQLVVLCSYAVTAEQVRRTWGRQVVAVDVEQHPLFTSLRTSRMLEKTAFRRDNDTAVKRNVGLAITRMTGWERVLFLDDDIDSVEPLEVMRAASLLDEFEVVGLRNHGYPDNSVVCHAYREVGAAQGTFIGAGAMLFRNSRTSAYFPDVYNEDWLFLLDVRGIARCAVYGGFAQKPYDPYQNPRRAGSQEFGDCLAEALFALLDAGLPLEAADRQFWDTTIRERGKLLEEILRLLPGAPVQQLRRARIAAALRAARTSLLKVQPEFCVEYLGALRADRIRWQAWLDTLPTGLDPGDALKVLGYDAG